MPETKKNPKGIGNSFMNYISNMFSFQMLEDFPYSLECEEITFKEFEECKKTAVSVIGNADIASILGLPCNRVSLKLTNKDCLVVAQLQRGHLPKGSTTLPEGFQFKYILVGIY